MNEYEIILFLETDPGRTEAVRVKCNNVPCAVRKAVVLALQKTRVKGWRYRSHRLVARGWEKDVLAQAGILGRGRRFIASTLR